MSFKWIVCFIKGHIWKFNNGDPLCIRCKKYQFKEPGIRKLYVKEKK